MMDENVHFVFVPNIIDVSCKLPFEIIPDHYFSKADDRQIDCIKGFLTSTFNIPSIPSWPSNYETAFVEEKQDQHGISYEFRDLERSIWKYYVIFFRGYNDKIHDLQLASNISDLELELSLTFINNNPQFFAVQFFHFMMNIGIESWRTPAIINEDNLLEIRKIYEKIQQVKEEYSEIMRAVEMFESLKLISLHSDFSILGLFAVIECLITHKPSNTESGDSLKRQIRTKIPLLVRRFQKELMYSKFFDNASDDTVWSKLYDYRSVLAHGEKSNFSKELSILKNRMTVQKFLHKVTKSLLRHALIEPQLYKDLKAC